MENEDLTTEIMNFINEKVKDLDNQTFKQVLNEVCDDIEAQLEAVEIDEQNN